MSPTLVTAPEAALYTGRSVGTIHRWASEGRISRHMVGKTVNFDIDDLPRAIRDEWTGELRLGEPPALPEGRCAA